MLAATPATERASRSGDNSVARTGGPLLTAPRCVRLRLQVCLATHQSQLRNHHFSNRPPRRLETTVTPRKQTAATRLNRQLSRIFGVTNHESQITNPGISKSSLQVIRIRRNSHKTKNGIGF